MKNLLNKKKEEDPQYELDLKQPFKNKLFKIKYRIVNFLAILETKRFFKKSMNWFLISLIVFLNLLLIDYLSEILGNLPREVPLLQNSLILSKRLILSESMQFLPVASVIFSFIGVFISYKIYNKKEYLSLIVLVVEVFSLSILLFNILSLTVSFIS